MGKNSLGGKQTLPDDIERNVELARRMGLFILEAHGPLPEAELRTRIENASPDYAAKLPGAEEATVATLAIARACSQFQITRHRRPWGIGEYKYYFRRHAGPYEDAISGIDIPDHIPDDLR